VKAGMLTQAQANQIEKRIQNGKGVPFFGLGGNRLGRHGVFHGPAAFGSGGPFGAAAGYLGLTVSQLMSDLGSGKSLAQIASSKGKSVSGLEQAMTSALKSRLDKAVRSGGITESEEQTLLSRHS